MKLNFGRRNDPVLPILRRVLPLALAELWVSAGMAVAEGRITPGEAESLARLLEARMRVVEFEALAQRVDKLENARTPIETGATAGPTLGNLRFAKHRPTICRAEARQRFGLFVKHL